MNFPGRILEWVTLSFSRGSSQPQDQTHVSCIAVDPLSLSHHGLTQYSERAQYLDKDIKNPSPGFLSSSSEALFSLVWSSLLSSTLSHKFLLLLKYAECQSFFFFSTNWGRYIYPSLGFNFPVLWFGKYYPTENWQCIIYFYSSFTVLLSIFWKQIQYMKQLVL